MRRNPQLICQHLYPGAPDVGFPISSSPLVPLACVYALDTYHLIGRRGLTPAPLGTTIYIVGPADTVVPSALYRDGKLVNPDEYRVANGTYDGPEGNFRPWCIVVFDKLQVDFDGRLYCRSEGDRMMAELKDAL